MAATAVTKRLRQRRPKRSAAMSRPRQAAATSPLPPLPPTASVPHPLRRAQSAQEASELVSAARHPRQRPHAPPPSPWCRLACRQWTPRLQAAPRRWLVARDLLLQCLLSPRAPRLPPGGAQLPACVPRVMTRRSTRLLRLPPPRLPRSARYPPGMPRPRTLRTNKSPLERRRAGRRRHPPRHLPCHMPRTCPQHARLCPARSAAPASAPSSPLPPLPAPASAPSSPLPPLPAPASAPSSPLPPLPAPRPPQHEAAGRACQAPGPAAPRRRPRRQRRAAAAARRPAAPAYRSAPPPPADPERPAARALPAVLLATGFCCRWAKRTCCRVKKKARCALPAGRPKRLVDRAPPLPPLRRPAQPRPQPQPQLLTATDAPGARQRGRKTKAPPSSGPPALSRSSRRPRPRAARPARCRNSALVWTSGSPAQA
eukprot:350238-Chlamydomonas_euryale.AAC.2